MRPLPRFDLIKSVVAAPPRPPEAANDNDIAVDGEDGTSSNREPQLEYITHLERSCDGGVIAAALSSLEIKLYSSQTMFALGQLSGHTGALTQLAFSPSDCHALFSASEDGTVRGWDARSLSSTATFGQSGEEVWSMALGYDGHLCATGKGCTVEFYDLRKTGKPLGTYEECHSDAVTQVRFHPHEQSFLLTGSEDGLMCFFDTGVSTEEDALDSVMNAECAVRSVGFFGPQGEGAYCCTNTETLSLWHASGAQRIKDFGDVRALARGSPPANATQALGNPPGDASQAGGNPAGDSSQAIGNLSGEASGAGHGAEGSRGGWGVQVDCIVGCHYDDGTDRLRLVTSGFDGGACVATISPGGITPEAVLVRGHSEQIRTFDWEGQTIFTGAEDARVCLWRVPGEGGGGGDGGEGLKRRREEEDDTAMVDVDGDGGSEEEEQMDTGLSPGGLGAGRRR